MARRLADLWAAFEAMAGPSWRDPWSVPARLRGHEPLRPLRVAVVFDAVGVGAAGQAHRGVRLAAVAMDSGGYAVKEVEPPSIERAAKMALKMIVPEMRAGWEMYSPFVRDFQLSWLALLFEAAGNPGPRLGGAGVCRPPGPGSGMG
jgi:amidase